MSQQPSENIKIDTPESYRQQTGVYVPQEKFRPFHATRTQLAELKSSIATVQDEPKKLDTAIQFMQANAGSQTEGVATDIAKTTTDAIKEGVQETKKQTLKELGVFGLLFTKPSELDPKELAEEAKLLMKKKSEAKGIDGVFDKIVSIFSLLIVKSKMKATGKDFSQFMSQEELKFLGIVSTIQYKTAQSAEKIKDNPYLRYDAATKVYQTVMIGKTSLPVANIFQHTGEGSLAKYSLEDLKKIHDTKQYSKIQQKFPSHFQSPEHTQTIQVILSSIFDGKKSKYMKEAYLSGMNMDIHGNLPASLTLQQYFEGSYNVIRRMTAIGKTMMTGGESIAARFYTKDKELSFSDPTEESEVLGLLGGDKKLLTFALINGSFKYKRGDIRSIDKQLNENSEFLVLYPEEVDRAKAIETMKQFFTFVEKFYSSIESNQNIHLGMNTELSNILNNNSLNIRGLMMVYLSYGKKDLNQFNNFSTIEQTEIYGYILSIFASQGGSFNKGKLTADYLTALEQSKLQIPQNVMSLMKDVLGYAAESGASTIWGGIQYFAGVAASNPRLATILFAMNVPIVPDRSSVAEMMF